MKKCLLVGLVLCMLLTVLPVAGEQTQPKLAFATSMQLGFQGREAAVRVKLKNAKAVKLPIIIQLQDETGAVILEDSIKSGSEKRLRFAIPSSWQGKKTLSLWAGGQKVSAEDLVFIADNLDNKQVKQIQTEKKQMAITLDCAYGDKRTQELLGILDEFGVKTTFFVTGNWARNYPHHMQDIISRGHEIGNHSFSHPRMTQKSLDVMYRQIERCSEAIHEAAGVWPTLFRPPYGDTNEKLRAVSRSLGCEVIMWTIDSRDFNPDLDFQTIYSRITRKVGPGHIILFHNDGRLTPSLLREIIPYYQQTLGLELVTVSTLLSEGPYTVNPEGLVQFQ